MHKNIISLCVSHRAPVFQFNEPYTLVCPVDCGVPNQIIAPENWLGERYSGKIISEYTQLFALSDIFQKNPCQYTHVHIFQYRKFISLKIDGEISVNMPYARTIQPAYAYKIFPSMNELISMNTDYLVGSVVRLRSLAHQYTNCHLVEDFSAFVLALRDQGSFDNKTCFKFINYNNLIPSPSLGLIPVKDFIEIMNMLRAVWDIFSLNYFTHRDGYQRRDGGFLLERLHSFILCNKLINNKVGISGMLYITSDTPTITPTV